MISLTKIPLSVLGYLLLFVACSANACVLCSGCDGLCFRSRTSGFSSCDYACSCFNPAPDCGVGVTVAGYASVKPCSEMPLAARTPLSNHERTVGLILVKNRHSGALVRGVLIGSAAFHAGLRLGDKVVSIDGNDASRMSNRQISRAIDHSTGRSISIVVTNGNGNRIYSLSPEAVTSLNQRIIEWRSHSNAMSTLSAASSGGGR